MVMTSPKAKKIRVYITSFMALVLFYFIISACFGLALGIKLPQPFPAGRPKYTYLSDPLANQPYTKTVNPGEIQKLLDNHPYNQTYKANVFDCSNMSQITAQFLQADGYHTSVIGDDVNHHAWAMVWANKNSGWAIETATDVSLARHSAGEVIGDNWWDLAIAYGHYKHQFVSNLLSGHGYEFYYPTKERSGLHVLEWNDPSLNNR
jgi:hypothetical protein